MVVGHELGEVAAEALHQAFGAGAGGVGGGLGGGVLGEEVVAVGVLDRAGLDEAVEEGAELSESAGRSRGKLRASAVARPMADRES